MKMPWGWGVMHEGCCFDNFQTSPGLKGHANREAALRAAVDWASKGDSVAPRPIWLVLLGRYGTGKTHLAAAATHALWHLREETVFVEVPAFLDWLRSTYRDGGEPADRAFRDLMEARYVVLDDLGAQRNTDWADERLYRLVNGRYVSRRPTLVTCNMALRDLEGRLASRLGDRRLSKVVDCGNFDYRTVE